MVKSHKRKHGDSVTDEGEATTSKKIRTNEGKAVWKKVKCKENSHSLSESEDEDSDRKVTGIESNVHSDKKESNRTNNDKAVRKKDKHKENRHSLSASEGDVSDRGVGIENKVHSNKNKRNRNSFNTHLLSSESGSAAELSFDLSSNKISLEEADGENGEVINSECRSRDSSEDRQDLTVESTQKETGSRKMPHRIPKFTHEFNEEISKFSLLLDENLIKKNDIWILQCPSNMDCSALISQRLGLEGSSQLNDGERTYETYSYRNSCTRTATLAVPSERNCLNLCKIPITGNIIVEESVKPVMNTKEIIPEPPSRVEFPENLRTRHPLLGIDFSKQPRTAEKVADHNPKKKKHSVKLSSSCNGVIESGSPSISTPVKKKKKNQERSREEIIQSDYAEQLVEEFVDGRAKERKKKKKHKDNDSLN